MYGDHQPVNGIGHVNIVQPRCLFVLASDTFASLIKNHWSRQKFITLSILYTF